MQRSNPPRRYGRLLALTASLALAAGLTACTSDPQATEPVTLDVNLTHSTGSLIYQTMQDVAERVAERTEGRVTIEIYPDSQLGSNEDAVEQALGGAPTVAHFNASAAASMGGVPEFLALGSAYVLESPDVIETLVASDLYADWTERLEANGFVVLSGNWLNGIRQVISTDPNGHPAPEDLAGVTIRIPAGDQFTTFFEATPALPVNLDPSETYTGMDQGTVNAAEGPLTQMVDWSLDELGKSVTLTNHMVELSGFAAGATTWARLSADDQAIVREEFSQGGRDYTQGGLALVDDIRTQMEDAGIVFYEADVEAYRALAEDAILASAAAAEWPEGLLDRLREAMGTD